MKGTIELHYGKCTIHCWLIWIILEKNSLLSVVQLDHSTSLNCQNTPVTDKPRHVAEV